MGLQGGEEPACREAFPWDGPSGWGADLRGFIASLAALRHNHDALCNGALQLEVLQGSEGDQGLRLLRHSHGEAIDASITAVINRSRHAPLQLDLSQRNQGSWVVLWPPEHRDGPLPKQLAPQSAVVLQRRTAQP